MLTALLTLPLAFPGVVIGFMVIMLAGRQGLIPDITEALIGEQLVFAYSMAGLFMGYVYFSIPRTILTVMAAAEKLDPRLEEAARSLGAWPLAGRARRHRSGAEAGIPRGRRHLLRHRHGRLRHRLHAGHPINVLPMVIYTEFTLQANIAMAAALSFVLGAITWAVAGRWRARRPAAPSRRRAE